MSHVEASKSYPGTSGMNNPDLIKNIKLVHTKTIVWSLKHLQNKSYPFIFDFTSVYFHSVILSLKYARVYYYALNC